MRYKVCELCKKHNPSIFDSDSKITCYDDCCINGNRFESKYSNNNDKNKTTDTILKIINEAMETKDRYVSLYFGEEGTQVSVYPLLDNHT